MAWITAGTAKDARIVVKPTVCDGSHLVRWRDATYNCTVLDEYDGYGTVQVKRGATAWAGSTSEVDDVYLNLTVEMIGTAIVVKNGATQIISTTDATDQTSGLWEYDNSKCSLVSFTDLEAGIAITASAGAGGTISPSGSVPVVRLADQTFTFAPSSGYVVSDVLVDGKSVGNPSFYTFEDVQQSATISVSFVQAVAHDVTVTRTLTDSATGVLVRRVIPRAGYEALPLYDVGTVPSPANDVGSVVKVVSGRDLVLQWGPVTVSGAVGAVKDVIVDGVSLKTGAHDFSGTGRYQFSNVTTPHSIEIVCGKEDHLDWVDAGTTVYGPSGGKIPFTTIKHTFSDAETVSAGDYIFDGTVAHKDRIHIIGGATVVQTDEGLAASTFGGTDIWMITSWASFDKFQNFSVEAESYHNVVNGVLDGALLMYPGEVYYAHAGKMGVGSGVIGGGGISYLWDKNAVSGIYHKEQWTWPWRAAPGNIIADYPEASNPYDDGKGFRWVKSAYDYEYDPDTQVARMRSRVDFRDGKGERVGTWTTLKDPKLFPHPRVGFHLWKYPTTSSRWAVRNIRVVKGKMDAYSVSPATNSTYQSPGVWSFPVKANGTDLWNAQVPNYYLFRNGSVESHTEVDSKHYWKIWDTSTNQKLIFPDVNIPTGLRARRLSFLGKNVSWRVEDAAGNALLSGTSPATESVVEIPLNSLGSACRYIRPTVTLIDNTSELQWLDVSWSDSSLSIVDITAGANGTVSESQLDVDNTTGGTFTVTPSVGYRVASITTSTGVTVTPAASGQTAPTEFTVKATQDGTVAVAFEPTPMLGRRHFIIFDPFAPTRL